MAKRVLKVGDIVRVGRCPNEYHGVKFGALLRIEQVFEDGDASVVRLSDNADPIGKDWAQDGQYVDLGLLKYAKQANAFDQRRG